MGRRKGWAKEGRSEGRSERRKVGAGKSEKRGGEKKKRAGSTREKRPEKQRAKEGDGFHFPLLLFSAECDMLILMEKLSGEGDGNGAYEGRCEKEK